MKKNLSVGLLALCASVSALADINIDSTGSTVAFSGKDSIQVNNLNVPGFGSYSLRFKWDPVALNFVIDLPSISAAPQSRCVSRVYNNSKSSNQFWASTRTISGVEYGGLIDTTAKISADNISFSYFWSDFVVNWAKTAKIEDNVYLKGRSVPSFDPNKGYGFISGEGLGFSQGDLIEVSGNLETNDFLLIKQVNGSISTAMSTGKLKAASFGCASGAGKYTGYNSATSSAIATSGDTALFEGNSFSASWSLSSSAGVIGKNTVTSDYGGLVTDNKIIVRDIGEGVTISAVDATGKVTGSYVFMRP